MFVHTENDMFMFKAIIGWMVLVVNDKLVNAKKRLIYISPLQLNQSRFIVIEWSRSFHQIQDGQFVQKWIEVLRFRPFKEWDKPNLKEIEKETFLKCISISSTRAPSAWWEII